MKDKYIINFIFKNKDKLDVKSLESMLDVALLSDDCKTSIGQKNALHKK